EITDLRCDGVVEYAYERNGVNVWGRSDNGEQNGDPTNFDVSNTKFTEEHNILCDLMSDPEPWEETCPQVQRGHWGEKWTQFRAAPEIPECEFSDIGANSRYEKSVNALCEKGIINGYPDGTFGVDKTINRAEFTKIVLLAKGEVIKKCNKNEKPFPDVSEGWFCEYVKTAKEENILDGYPDGTFKPGNTINKVEAAKMLVNALIGKTNAHTVPTMWYKPFITKLCDKVPDDVCDIIKPAEEAGKKITRGEMAILVYNLIKE
ncbi:S-layer homology domain-containing protein, partial [Candidatus Marithioploca araucensis]|nr:S-layer homology domain-containing protein [Candidatus Marithioploca araucensis]